jgi:long-chain acyl-CoA synthetase
VLTEWATHVDVELLDFAELEKWGASEGIRADPGPVKGVPGEEQLDQHRVASISYTSGTTGESPDLSEGTKGCYC